MTTHYFIKTVNTSSIKNMKHYMYYQNWNDWWLDSTTTISTNNNNNNDKGTTTTNATSKNDDVDNDIVWTQLPVFVTKATAVVESNTTNTIIAADTEIQHEHHHQQQQQHCYCTRTGRRKRNRKLLLDIRSREEYQQQHFISTLSSSSTTSNDQIVQQQQQKQQELVVVHIPIDELSYRRYELPPRQIPFAILSSFINNTNTNNYHTTATATETIETATTATSTTDLDRDEVNIQQQQKQHYDNYYEQIQSILLFGQQQKEERKTSKNKNHDINNNNNNNNGSNNKKPKSTNLSVSSSSKPLQQQQQQASSPQKQISHLQPSWNVCALFNANDPLLWQDAQRHHIQICINNNNNNNNNNEKTTPPLKLQLPLPRLWSPDPMIEDILLPLLQTTLQNCTRGSVKTSNNMNDNIDLNCTSSNNSNVLEIWDLGSGLGRDVCFLAEELLFDTKYNVSNNYYNSSNTSIVDQQKQEGDGQLPGFRIIGFDQRYRPSDNNNTNSNSNNNANSAVSSVSITRDFWKRRHVQTVTQCCYYDLKSIKTKQDINQLVAVVSDTACSSNTIRCIYAVRYWNKELFQLLINSGIHTDHDDTNTNDSSLLFSLNIGTFIAISHFGKASKDTKWDHIHPHEKHILERNELRTMFTESTNSKTNVSTTNNSTLCSSQDDSKQQQQQQQRSWKILHDEVIYDSDCYGRTLIQFVAQLVANS